MEKIEMLVSVDFMTSTMESWEMGRAEFVDDESVS